MSGFLSSQLPIPGAVWGAYPRRTADRPGASLPGWPERLVARLAADVAAVRDALASGSSQRRLAATLQAVRAHQAAWRALSSELARHRLANLRARLARDGLRGDVLAEALGCVAATGERVLGRSPYDTQLQAALILLDNRLAEMATGEGKTYAAGIAAAVAALSGVPVHVITANDYLAVRDAQALAPLHEALMLSVGTVTSASDVDHRRAAYACHLTYCTAREVAFDHLRDELSGASAAHREESFTPSELAVKPLLRGLCMAIVDEADSVLIDEATMPLILSEPVADPQQRASSFQAMAAARPLCSRVDFLVHADERRIELTEAGLDRLNATAPAASAAKPTIWMHPRLRRDLTIVALEALHLMQRDRDYVVRDGAVQLLDAITGRTAQGRVWSRGLQTMVELKEGCKPSTATVTRAQITYQRFFPRYLRLCGMSGTLEEAAGELRSTYRLAVSPVPRRCANRAQALPRRLFIDADARRRAAALRVARLHRTGRPVLVGCDSLAESQAMSGLLADAGVAHRVLDARHDADEAAVVAAAGRRGAVTVATRMAGRGTDIVPGDGVAALGGLHVLSLQDNPSRRLDRQLTGRAARAGDPGSHELWQVLDGPLHHRSSWLRACRNWCDRDGALKLSQGWLERLAHAAQEHEERKTAGQRRRLLEQDLEWERRLHPES